MSFFIFNILFIFFLQDLKKVRYSLILHVVSLEQHIKLHCFGYEFDYSYEYHGPSQYIVCTPFTERCIFAILIAMQQYQVGCLFGSVGNGKSAVCSHVSKVSPYAFIYLCLFFMQRFWRFRKDRTTLFSHDFLLKSEK